MTAKQVKLIGGSALSALLLLSSHQSSAREPAKIGAPPSADTATKQLASSPRHGEWVDVPLAESDTKIHAWVVYPERKDKAPVVIVIHEIFGMSDWVRAVADQLAAEGFIAVAPDLLSGKGPNGGGTESFAPEEVGRAVVKLTPDEVAGRLDAVRAYALAFPSASSRSAAIGFCWGGGASFNYAARRPALNADVVYYGTPPDRAALARIRSPVFGFYGGDDSRVTSTVADTSNTMTQLKKSYRPHIYVGAGHGFLRQQSGRNGANLKAAQEAWTETLKFLKKNLK